nr:hypothetical protein [uncultured Acetatifactor sp.]
MGRPFFFPEILLGRVCTDYSQWGWGRKGALFLLESVFFSPVEANGQQIGQGIESAEQAGRAVHHW